MAFFLQIAGSIVLGVILGTHESKAAGAFGFLAYCAALVGTAMAIGAKCL